MKNNNLALYRKKNGYTQTDIAKILNTTQDQISKYERGDQEMNIKRYIQLAILYDCTIDQLCGLK